MKTFSNKSNAKRSAISTISKQQDVPKEWVKENIDKLVSICQVTENGWAAVAHDDWGDLIEEYKKPQQITTTLKAIIPESGEPEIGLEPGTYPVKTDAITFGSEGNINHLVSLQQVGRADRIVEPPVKVLTDCEYAISPSTDRPGASTICGQIWAFCDSFYVEHEQAPTSKNIMRFAKDNDINIYTARTQYARWKESCSIFGRVKHELGKI